MITVSLSLPEGERADAEMNPDYVPWLVLTAVIAALMIFKRLGQISPDKARSLVKSGARLIDVRSPAEFAAGHIDGAVNVPVGALSDDKLGPKDQPLILYCASGTRSAIARTALKTRGFTHVFNLGAMNRW